ncbi:hypothetical protein [Rubidibacter lacunae]|nr:hypothetical protein [Rubidibacter lacunae]
MGADSTGTPVDWRVGQFAGGLPAIDGDCGDDLASCSYRPWWRAMG